jgi:signal transduction histidine kinase
VQVPDVNWLPYGWLLLSRAISWLLVDSFIQTHSEREAINLALERRIDAFGQELQSQYSRIAELERRDAVSAERERIVRDMHDGLGFHLITALNQVTGRSLTQPELVEVFSNALSELEGALQATAPVQNDLIQALGELRSRVEAGLRDAGLGLQWEVAPEVLARIPGGAAVQEAILIVQEALTNAIKHSRSSIVQLRAQTEADGAVRIRVIDEGVGTGGGADGGPGQAGEGMNSMRWRAERIGGRLDLFSRPGRTEVVLTLP